jgi:hypothetical protein
MGYIDRTEVNGTCWILSGGYFQSRFVDFARTPDWLEVASIFCVRSIFLIALFLFGIVLPFMVEGYRHSQHIQRFTMWTSKT